MTVDLEDQIRAYATLLDEYGPPNPADDNGKPIPVPAGKRLRPKSNWNGIRLEPPQGFDTGAVRFALGYMFWQKGDWAGCAKSLAPFAISSALALVGSCMSFPPKAWATLALRRST